MASKRHIRRKSCEGKRRFLNSTLASQAAQSYTKRFSSFVNAYKCRFCGFWHIGHPGKRIKQAIVSRKGYLQ